MIMIIAIVVVTTVAVRHSFSERTCAGQEMQFNANMMAK